MKDAEVAKINFFSTMFCAPKKTLYFKPVADQSTEIVKRKVFNNCRLKQYNKIET